MKSKKSYIVLIIFLIFLCDHISCNRSKSYASALINDKLYIFGGVKIAGDLNNLPSNFFFIDFSNIPFLNKFNDAEYPWIDLTLPSINNNNITCWGTTAVAGGVNNTSFILFSSQLSLDNNKDNSKDDSKDDSNSILSFNTITNTWSRPNIIGIPPIRRKNTQAVINNSNGKMYIFGGSTDPLFTNYNSDYSKSTFYNDMIILDTINWTWNYGSNINAPSRRNDFSAVILSSGIIVYIGGSLSNGSYAEMDQLYLFNTETNEWNAMIANGDIPDSREGASSVLTSDGKILVFGGAKKPRNSKFYDIPFSSMLAILDTTKSPYEWSIPKIRNSEPPLPPLIYHSATLVKDMMVIAFGNIINAGSSSKIYMFDTKNYEWVNTKESKKRNERNERSKRNKIKERNGKIERVRKRDGSTSSTSPSPTSSSPATSKTSTLVIVITTVSASIFVLISIIVTSCLCRKYKNRKVQNKKHKRNINNVNLQQNTIEIRQGPLVQSPQISPSASSTAPLISPDFPPPELPPLQFPPQKHIIQYQFIPNLPPSTSTNPSTTIIAPSYPSYSSYIDDIRHNLPQNPAPIPKLHSSPAMPTFEVPAGINSPQPQIIQQSSSSQTYLSQPSYPSHSIPIMPTFEVPSKQNSPELPPPPLAQIQSTISSSSSSSSKPLPAIPSDSSSSQLFSSYSSHSVPIMPTFEVPSKQSSPKQSSSQSPP
ncbi:hypothetical protein Glove_82g97 [Diversispora epigaea]|uniref:Attractin/MKLN-like beta-propeller domain-containing protein n=1 Tax=Diversispora epigaea TaxID=1348612 RepID=A0A397JC80_9GLOM|nr:hypothetical protein Glove_82g97 [Diversispora epigaea]